ncbi:ATP-binding protein [Marinobacter persicus]|nr:ATP-binding protein [Marinobacter persicus]
MDLPTESYGLENIVLHHSFKKFAGRTVRIECKDRTHVGGTNGAGKTSILHLIPAFYGEEPDRIVSRAGGRDPFVEFYLKSLQSLIIFEYRRHTGLCCAVMYRHQSGKLCYRFVEGGLEDTFFRPDIKEALGNGATNDVIFEALREAGVQMSPMIGTITDYRAIIQRNSKLIKRQPAEARRLRALANDYGLGGPDTRMSHIDRLTHVVLNKNRLLSSFKSMICETMFDSIHINKRPTILHERDLVNDIRSIKEFEREEAAIRECLVKDAERKGIAEQAARTATQLRETVAEQKEIRKELLSQIDRLQTDLETEEVAFNDKDSELSRREVDLGNEIRSLNERLNRTFEQQDEYERKGLPELDQELDNLNEYRQQFQNAKDDHETLTGKVSALESDHIQKIDQINQAFQQAQNERTSRITTAERRLENEKHLYEHGLTTLESDQNKEVASYREERHNKRRELGEQEVRLETQLANPSFTPEEQRQIQEAEGLVAQREDDLHAAARQVTEATNKREQARHDRNTAQTRLEDAEGSVNRLDGEFQALQRQLTPERDSWLAKLREDDPRWGETLGKVINPDLLERSDLSPELIEAASETVMGWRLDYESVPVPPLAATEDQIRARLEEKDAQCQQAQRVYKEAETAAQKSNTIFQDRAREVEQIESRQTLHERQLENAKTALTSVRNAASQAQNERLTAIERELRAIKERLVAFDQETRNTAKHIEDRYAKLRMERKGQWATKEAELTEAIGKARELAAQATEEHEHRIKTLNEAHASRLKDEGVNPEEVRRAREKKDALEKKIQKIEQAQTEIHEYRSWRTREWAKVETWQAECAGYERQLEDVQRKRRGLKNDYEQTKKSFTGKISECKKRVAGIQQAIEEAETILLKFQDADSGTRELPGNLKALTDQLREAYRDLEKLREMVIKAVRKATSVLNKYENTQVYQAWRKLQEYRVSQLPNVGDRYGDDFELSQTESLRLLLEQDLPQLRAALITQFTNAAGELRDYFGGLQQLVREVKQASNQLQRAINTDQQIESISDIEVVLKPRIYEDDSWAPLKNFVESWENWQLSHRTDIPSDELVSDFHQVVNTLRSARIRDDMESMVDMRLQLRENERLVIIRNDNDFLNASSTGLTYLAIMAVFIGMTRYLAPDLSTRITWPIDELGTLSANNISRLASMLEKQNVTMISACPKLDHGLRKFFENKVSIKDGRVNIFGQHNAAQDTGNNKRFAQVARQRQETEDQTHAE